MPCSANAITVRGGQTTDGAALRRRSSLLEDDAMLDQLLDHVGRARAFLAEPNEAADQIEHVDDDEREGDHGAGVVAPSSYGTSG